MIFLLTSKENNNNSVIREAASGLANILQFPEGNFFHFY